MNEYPHDSSQPSLSSDIKAIDGAIAPPFTPDARTLPRSVLFVAIALIIFIGLLSLEASDSLFRHDGQIARSLFVLPGAILLFRGVLTRRRWAWWAVRVIALMAAALYAVPFVGVWFFSGHMQTGQRIWISAVSAGLMALVLTAYSALGRRPARSYFHV